MVAESHRLSRSLPLLPTTDEIVRRLSDDDYCLSEEHQSQRFLTDWDGANPVLKEFERVFVKEAAKRRIPVHCMVAGGDTAIFVHSQWGMLLQNPDWAVIGRVGFLAMPALHPSRLGWGGHGGTGLPNGAYQPHVWYVTDSPPF